MILEPIVPDSSGHFLVTASGQPFFWLADTAWELFHRLNRIEAERYLETRRKQGFNVIQAVILAELDGLHTPNANGHVPLLGDDPTRPNEYYFRYVDEIIRLAAAKGLYIGLLPTWADKVDGKWWGIGPAIFNPENARIYGKFLGQRYRNDSNILWILGGDRSAVGYEVLWAAMAGGIMEGLGRRPFFTYHPRGGNGSSEWLHDADWLDMNMWQSGHSVLDAPNWKMVASDYNRTPPKPVLDSEPNYEDHRSILSRVNGRLSLGDTLITMCVNRHTAPFFPGLVDIRMGTIRSGSFGTCNGNRSISPCQPGMKQFCDRARHRWNTSKN